MKEQKYVIEYIPVDDLIYDKENPRLPRTVVNTDNDDDVIDWMLKDASIIELMGSIGEKGFFPGEPLLAVRKGTSKKYIVVEGNRRLTAVKLLNKPQLAKKRRSTAIQTIASEAKNKPAKLPVMVFPKRKEILDYLGFKHITGVKQWSALAKAKYLKELQEGYEQENISNQYKMLAKAIGSRSDYVRDLLIGLEVYEKIHSKNYFNIADLDEESIDFGVYYNALKFGNIPTFLGIDKNLAAPTKNINLKSLEEFTRIISEKDTNGETRLGESRNLTILNSIILEPKSYKLFKSGKSLDEAAMYLEGPHEIFRKSLSRTIDLLKGSLLVLKEITRTTQSDAKLVEEAKTLIADIRIQIQSKKK